MGYPEDQTTRYVLRSYASSLCLANVDAVKGVFYQGNLVLQIACMADAGNLFCRVKFFTKDAFDYADGRR